MPFITEKLSRELFHETQLLFEAYPVVEPEFDFSDINDRMRRLEQALYMIREIRAANNLQSHHQPAAILAVKPELRDFFERNKASIRQLSRLGELVMEEFGRVVQSGEATVSEHDFQIFVDLTGVIDKEVEIGRLQKEKARLEQLILSVRGKLDNKQFLANAPREVITREEDKRVALQTELEHVTASLRMWGA